MLVLRGAAERCRVVEFDAVGLTASVVVDLLYVEVLDLV